MFLPKDFIQTADGLIFAVVAQGLENNKVRCFLRYVQSENGQWRKVQTDEANKLLAEKFPDYLFHSSEFDAFLHAVSVEKIVEHNQPSQRLRELLTHSPRDEIEKNCSQLSALFENAGVDLAQFGVTGSLLIGQQKATSDIDLVCYDLAMFHQARKAIQTLIQQNLLQNLQLTDWQESYARRDCDLSFENYVWHEKRKFNKGLINGRKFDLSLIEKFTEEKHTFSKLGNVKIQTYVTSDSRGFCYPAEFEIAHVTIQKVVCFTATYIGQVAKGEKIEVCGQLEQDEFGKQRIVIGSSREARGEYCFVCDDQPAIDVGA
jgi:predicted nucleotidyltransferase